jgi:hypothetical protein
VVSVTISINAIADKTKALIIVILLSEEIANSQAK